MSEQSGRSTNEIDLKDLLKAILATRVWVIIALLVVTLGYWTVQTLVNFALPTVRTYSTRINFVFKGIQDGNYPNDSPFNINDIIAPVVLNKVYDEDGVSKYLSREDFVNAFSVAPYTPDRAIILKKYSDKLRNTKLTSADLDAMQKQLNNELQNAAQGSATISFSSTAISGLPKLLIDKVLRDVPAEWARHMVNDVGVTRLDQPIYTDKVVENTGFHSMDYLIALEMLSDRVSMLNDNISTIKSLPNGMVVVDDKTGLNVSDLQKAVSDIDNYEVGPLVDRVTLLGIAKHPDVVRQYFESRLRKMTRDTQQLLQQRKAVQEAYSNYVGSSAMNEATEGSRSSGLSSGSVIPQISSNFLTRLLQMMDLSADRTYRQDLNKQLLDASDRYARQEAKKQRIQDIIASLKSGNRATPAVTKEFAKEFDKKVPEILAQLKTDFQISNRLYLKLSRQELGVASTMYKPADGNITFSESRNILNLSNLRLYLIICFLTIVVVVPVAMIRSAIRS